MGKAPGKAHRQGLTLLEVAERFANEEDARAWIEKLRWPEGPCCPHCGSFNVQCNIKHQNQTHRCRECPHKPMFTLRVGTVMQGTHLKYREWAIGIYLYTNNIKRISSIQLHRELGISQKAAWFLLHRLRTATEKGKALFSGPVEIAAKPVVRTGAQELQGMVREHVGCRSLRTVIGGDSREGALRIRWR